MTPLEFGTAGAVAVISLVQFLFFFRSARLGKSSWASAYVCFVESSDYLITILISITKSEYHSGLYIKNGQGVPIHFIRYIEWLITCPIIVNEMVVLEQLLLKAERLKKRAEGRAVAAGDLHSFELNTELGMVKIEEEKEERKKEESQKNQIFKNVVCT
jgi:hypothetical protein